MRYIAASFILLSVLVPVTMLLVTMHGPAMEKIGIAVWVILLVVCGVYLKRS